MYTIIYTPGCNKDIANVTIVGVHSTIDDAKNDLCNFVNIDKSELDKYQHYPDDGGWDSWNKENQTWDHHDEPDHLQYDFDLSGEKIEELLDICLDCKTSCVNGHLFHICETNSGSCSDLMEAKKCLAENLS